MKRLACLMLTSCVLTACGGLYGGHAPVYNQNYHPQMQPAALPMNPPPQAVAVPPPIAPVSSIAQPSPQQLQRAHAEALQRQQQAHQEALRAAAEAEAARLALLQNQQAIQQAEQQHQALMQQRQQQEQAWNQAQPSAPQIPPAERQGHSVPDAPVIAAPKTPAPAAETNNSAPAARPEMPAASAEPAPETQNVAANRPARSGGNEAVSSLLKKASDAIGKGDLDGAAGYLENAQRLNPNNSKILYDIANVRYHQGRYRDAETFAGRAIKAGGSHSTLKKSWSLIANARKALGDNPGAVEAAEKATSY